MFKKPIGRQEKENRTENRRQKQKKKPQTSTYPNFKTRIANEDLASNISPWLRTQAQESDLCPDITTFWLFDLWPIIYLSKLQ